MSAAVRHHQDPALADRYITLEGTVLLTGIQALVRVLVDQRRADQRRGLRTAGLVSGYRGSPLAGFDLTLQRERRLLAEHDVVFIPGVNEDLAATALFGSQLVNQFPRPKYEGVFGMWYGKSPGVDRSGDAFKHANFAGAAPNGGVLAVAGDDPACTSSTLPSHSEVAFFDAFMPVLCPASVQELLDYGRLGVELSRYSGLWVGLKVPTDIADAIETVEVAPDRPRVVRPEFEVDGRPWQPSQSTALLAPRSIALEREIHEGRLPAAAAFAASNGLNAVTVSASRASLGIAAVGQSYAYMREALALLGLDTDEAIASRGIRLLKVGMLYPLEPSIVRSFAGGLEQLLVVEEKRPMLETFIRDALYGTAGAPRVLGKRDAEGKVLMPAWGALDVDTVAAALLPFLRSRLPEEALRRREREAAADVAPVQQPKRPARQAFFCSGCPHNVSTVVPEGSLAAGGIGCHGMALLQDRQTVGITHMGGEGVQWVGAAPFSEQPHLFQNLGDGTLFHSGSLAIRQAVAAGTSITFKVLYNSAVGMTGGQAVDGAVSVPDLTRALEAEGVRRIIVTSDEPDRYPRDARWGAGTDVWPRERLDEAQRELRDTPGVTVLIHDQVCAAELRRLRKRGKAPERPLRVWINERVCEGCGDCGEKSNCLSVTPVETEFGRKTRIDQSSCNTDYSCLAGDCPSFVTVRAGKPEAEAEGRGSRRGRQGDGVAAEVAEVADALAGPIPEPAKRVSTEANVLLVGVGGTGIITINHILATAAFLDGLQVSGLDQTGLSQKAGPVASHLRISAGPVRSAGQLPRASTDCLLSFDLLAAVRPDVLSRLAPHRTIAAISTSTMPTGAMVIGRTELPEVEPLLATVRSRVRDDAAVALDAFAVVEALFGDHVQANTLMLGVAYQLGALPVTAAAIERAIALNGVAAQRNIAAFRAGRLRVADPHVLEALLRRTEPEQARPEMDPAAAALIDTVAPTGELRRLLEVRVPELIAYQDVAYARRYMGLIGDVAAAEERTVPGATGLREAVARHLFKLMAFKDEYEVARLHLAGTPEAVRARFGGSARYAYMVHPPLLRALGLEQKIAIRGRWANLLFRALYRMRRLRGTRFDPFGYAKVRRVERELIAEYRALIEGELRGLTPATHERLVALASLPDLVRGYEDVKLRSVERYRAAWEQRSVGRSTVDDRRLTVT